MGMDVYAYASFDDRQKLCMMCWRKPYAFEAWLGQHGPQDGMETEGYTVRLTPALFAMAEKLAEADIESGEGDFWHQWTDTDFNWRARLALEAGATIMIYVSP